MHRYTFHLRRRSSDQYWNTQWESRSLSCADAKKVSGRNGREINVLWGWTHLASVSKSSSDNLALFLRKIFVPWRWEYNIPMPNIQSSNSNNVLGELKITLATIQLILFLFFSFMYRKTKRYIAMVLVPPKREHTPNSSGDESATRTTSCAKFNFYLLASQ